MFNLVISADESDWEGDILTMSASRMFEHTENSTKANFGTLLLSGGIISADYSKLKSLPTVLAFEVGIQKPARVVSIVQIQLDGPLIKFTCKPDNRFLAVQNIYEENFAFNLRLNLKDFEGHRTHWAVKTGNIDDFWPKQDNHNKKTSSTESNLDKPMIFVVHGHDEGAKHQVARFLEKAKLSFKILSELPDQGRTIIEKFQHHASASNFAIILLTADDVGGTDSTKLQPRARQNVILELGYFMALLGRERVCALKKGEIEVPSDFSGVIYKNFDTNEGWKRSLLLELQSAGFKVDPAAYE